MFEEWLGKRVKLFLLIGDQELIRTGHIIEIEETHILFRDKFGREETFAISTVQQIQGAEE